MEPHWSGQDTGLLDLVIMSRAGKGGKKHFTVEKPEIHYSHQMINLTRPENRRADTTCLEKMQ